MGKGHSENGKKNRRGKPKESRKLESRSQAGGCMPVTPALGG